MINIYVTFPRKIRRHSYLLHITAYTNISYVLAVHHHGQLGQWKIECQKLSADSPPEFKLKNFTFRGLESLVHEFKTKPLPVDTRNDEKFFLVRELDRETGQPL